MFGKEKSSDERRFRVAPDVSTEVVGERASSAGVLLFSAVLFVVVLACVLGVCALATGRVTLGLIIVAALAALDKLPNKKQNLLLFFIKILNFVEI